MERSRVERFLETALGSDDLREACRRRGLKISGTKDERIGRILDAVPNWESLVALLPVEPLREACSAFRLDATGSLTDLGSRLKNYLETAPPEQFDSAWDRYLDGSEDGKPWGSEPTSVTAAPGSAASGAASAPICQPLDPTRDNLIQALRTIRITSRLRDEYDAQEALFAELAQRFGDAVGREKGLSGYTFTRVDIDVDHKFGIEVKHAASLFRQRGGHANEVERLLGQTVLYRRQYAPENIIVVVAGEIEPEQRAVLRELQRLIEEDQKGVLIHVETR